MFRRGKLIIIAGEPLVPIGGMRELYRRRVAQIPEGEPASL